MYDQYKVSNFSSINPSQAELEKGNLAYIWIRQRCLLNGKEKGLAYQADVDEL